MRSSGPPRPSSQITSSHLYKAGTKTVTELVGEERMKREIMILVALTVAIVLIPVGVASSGGGVVRDLVVLLTDYGTSDYYVGALEGSIYSENPQARISTITHQVSSFNIAQGSYILAQAAREFPPGTVFAAEVDPGVGTDGRSIVLETEDGKLFVGPDNGLFSGVMDDLGVAAVREIRDPMLAVEGKAAAFRGIGIYGPVAGRLSAGMDPSSVGPEIFDPVRIEARRAGIEGGALVGAVVHVDHFGNLVTNIPHPLAEEGGLASGDRIEISVGEGILEAAFGSTYADVPVGEWVAFIDRSGRLVIAINMGSAAEVLAASFGEEVRVRKV